MKAQFTCKACGHEFDRLNSQSPLICPRCGGGELEENPYLFGTAEGGLPPEDYFDTLLAPCCQPNWTGWCRQLHSSQPLPDKEKDI